MVLRNGRLKRVQAKPHRLQQAYVFRNSSNLHELPFPPEPRIQQFLYLSKQHARAKAYMESTILVHRRFWWSSTGEIGAGQDHASLKNVPARNFRPT